MPRYSYDPGFSDGMSFLLFLAEILLLVGITTGFMFLILWLAA